MRIIKDITEDETIAAFLKAEIGSFRFGEKIHQQLKADGRERSTIDDPDISSKEPNDYRRFLLGKYRGYGENRGLFRHFPKNVSWKRVVLDKEDLKRMKYINYDYWVELSGGSRLIIDVAKNIIEEFEVFKQSNRNFWEVVEALKRGVNFPESILVTADEHSDLFVLEVHLRLTTYLMEPRFVPERFEVIIGFSEGLRRWGLY